MRHFFRSLPVTFPACRNACTEPFGDRAWTGAVALLTAASLAACGGGSSDSAETPAETPAAETSGVHVLAVTAPTWTTIVGEGQHFTLAGTHTVRYGSGTAWISRTLTDAGDCTNAAFGSDPLPGTVKQCQLPTAEVVWTKLVAENANFTLARLQTLRYGAGSTWLTKTLAGAGTCSNGFFGSDPVPGVFKECDVASGGVPAPAPPPVATAGVCTPPATAVDTSTVAASVGNGTPASCTEAALRAAVAAQSVVKFNCGASPATIRITSTIAVPAARNTVIDGENRITLDGGGTTRLLSVSQANYRTNRNGLTLQHLTLSNARAAGGGYVAPDPAHPACAYGYASGAGAAVQVQDARLYVFDVDFENNAAATPGPDVGGGAVYALGSLDVLIEGSRFNGNSGANGGAVKMLNSDLRVYNSVFQANIANGPGQNVAGSTASCPGVAYAGQGGSGGSGGAVNIDGGDGTDVTVCGTSFVGNHANGLAGAFVRTPDGAARRTTIDRSLFQANTAAQAGALYMMNSAPLEILASTFAGNSATAFGAAQLQSNTFSIVNSTFSGNEATHGVAGALALNGNGAASLILNSTFADNKASGGPGYFAAAFFGDTNFPIRNTVFSNNTTTDPYNPMQCGFSAAPGSADLQWPRTRAVGGYTDTPCVSGIGFADPLLGALGSNGGPTPTRLPAATSPLRGAGSNCPATDQRGNARSTTGCTIGAVE